MYLCVCVCMCTHVCTCTHVHTQSCPTLCNPMNYSPPGPSVHGIFQARILEQFAISCSRESSQLTQGSPALVGRSFTAVLPGESRICARVFANCIQFNLLLSFHHNNLGMYCFNLLLLMTT